MQDGQSQKSSQKFVFFHRKSSIMPSLDKTLYKNTFMSKSAVLAKPVGDHQKQVYQTPQQVQYLYLEAELNVLLRQLQTCGQKED